MILGLCLICVACLGWAIAAPPPSADGHRRDHDRRFRRLYQNPEHVNRLDVENLLLADGIPEGAVSRALRRAEANRICARTMWAWADRHGSDRLVDALDAGLAEDTMLDHLDAGTTPEWHSLSVCADLANDFLPAGMPLDELVDLDAVPAISDLTFAAELDDWTTHPVADDLVGFDSLPAIADPGFAPFSAAEALGEEAPRDSQTVSDDDEADLPDPAASGDRKDVGGGGDWPAVA